MGVFDSFKSKISGAFKDDESGKGNYELSDNTPAEDYLEVGSFESNDEEVHSKLIVRPFLLVDFEDTKEILGILREGRTVALINIRPLKEKDLIELKRSINKLKKTCEAIGGDIAGFGDEDWIVITPKHAEIYKSKQMDYFED